MLSLRVSHSNLFIMHCHDSRRRHRRSLQRPVASPGALFRVKSPAMRAGKAGGSKRAGRPDLVQGRRFLVVRCIR